MGMFSFLWEAACILWTSSRCKFFSCDPTLAVIDQIMLSESNEIYTFWSVSTLKYKENLTVKMKEREEVGEIASAVGMGWSKIRKVHDLHHDIVRMKPIIWNSEYMLIKGKKHKNTVKWTPRVEVHSSSLPAVLCDKCSFLQSFLLGIIFTSLLISVICKLVWPMMLMLISWGHPHWQEAAFAFREEVAMPKPGTYSQNS